LSKPRIQPEQRRREAAVVKKLRNSELILKLRKRVSGSFAFDLFKEVRAQGKGRGECGRRAGR
jgi:hypothetical protein